MECASMLAPKRNAEKTDLHLASLPGAALPERPGADHALGAAGVRLSRAAHGAA